MSFADHRSAATVAVLAAAVLFGTTGTAQALAESGGSPYAVGAMRLVVGAAGLLAFAVVTGRRMGEIAAVLRAPAGLVAAAAVALYQVGFFAGVDRVGVAVGTLVGIGAAPVFAGVLGATVDRTGPRPAWWAAVGVALCGLALLAIGGGGGPVDAVGLLLMLLAAAAYAVMVMAQRRLVRSGAAPAVVMAATFTAAAVVLVPVLAADGVGWLWAPSGWVLVLYLGLVPTTLAYLLVGYGVRFLSPPSVVSLNLAEPITAALLGVVVLDEPVTVAGAVGALLVLAGLVLIGRTVAAGDSGSDEPTKWGESASATAVPARD